MDLLLPDSDAQPRCSMYTRNLGIDPVGTAVSADQIFLVDVPKPWPKPVRDHPLLAESMELVDTLEIRSRLFASVSDGRRPRVVRFRRSSAGMTRLDQPREPNLPAQLAALGTPGDGGDPASLPVLLVCTQGSHDVCCGSDGERFAAEVEAQMPDVEVFRISHTGGHRFAPTGMTLPDGRMWAHMDLGLLEAVVHRMGEPATIAGSCRGWSGADAGYAQAAERAIFARMGWVADDSWRLVSVSPISDAAAVCSVVADDLEWRVQVEVAREVPTISCRASGGRPVKAAPEYRVVDVARLSPTSAR